MPENEISLTYEQLYEIVRREKLNQDLQKLDPEIYSKIIEYLTLKKNIYKKTMEEARKQLNEIEGIKCQVILPGTEEIGLYVFPFKFDPKIIKVTKDDFYKKLGEKGIPTDDCYPPLHSLACFKNIKGKKGIDYSKANWGGDKSNDNNFPEVTKIYRNSVEFPQEMFLVKEPSQLDYVAESVKDIIKYDSK